MLFMHSNMYLFCVWTSFQSIAAVGGKLHNYVAIRAVFRVVVISLLRTSPEDAGELAPDRGCGTGAGCRPSAVVYRCALCAV